MKEKNIKILVAIIIYLIFFGYPILVLTNCSGSEAYGIYGCSIDFLENKLSDTIFMTFMFSSFLFGLPIFIYISFIIGTQIFLNFIIGIFFLKEFNIKVILIMFLKSIIIYFLVILVIYFLVIYLLFLY